MLQSYICSDRNNTRRRHNSIESQSKENHTQVDNISMSEKLIKP